MTSSFTTTRQLLSQFFLLLFLSQDIAELEKRIAALEVGKSYDATKEAVEKVEKEFLSKLREIRAELANEGSSSKELEYLRAENEELKRKNAKLEYRVQHVVANMEKMYKFNETS